MSAPWLLCSICQQGAQKHSANDDNASWNIYSARYIVHQRLHLLMQELGLECSVRDTTPYFKYCFTFLHYLRHVAVTATIMVYHWFAVHCSPLPSGINQRMIQSCHYAWLHTSRAHPHVFIRRHYHCYFYDSCEWSHKCMALGSVTYTPEAGLHTATH